MKVKLGQVVRDKMTGYQGTVVAITNGLHGCTRICVQANELKDGKPVDNYTFDEPQAEIIKENFDEPATPAHGARENISRNVDPN
ncbi:hypothetical protein M0R72_12905 [Candidatus Pacearchaeota archaeon]|jgi:heat shock protein HspQ|nr:hypothetical protein [Candidatus Pacearchaeota archaeon]